MKLTENQVVEGLMQYLQNTGWEIDDHCLGFKHGIDIVAVKENTKLIVEAKGARANDGAHNAVRKQFDSGQLKTHLGKAIVKILEEMTKNPRARFAIAHPDDVYIRQCIGPSIKHLKKMGIIHYWVAENGNVTEE